MDIVDQQGNILFVNKNLEKIVGKQSIGKKCWELYKDNKEQCHICPLRSEFKIGHTSAIETESCFGGRAFQISHTGMIYNGKRAVLEIFEDITTRKQIEHYREGLVRTVSHELKNPLTIIKESINLILDGVAGGMNEEQKKVLSAASNNINRLIRIASNLLDMSKLEMNKLQLKRSTVDLNQLVGEAAMFLKNRAKEKGIELKINIPDKKIFVYADGDRLTQVFTNLIVNAIKFTDKGFVEIKIKPKNSTVECSIKDTGRGISRKDQQNLFGLFQQFGGPAIDPDKGAGLGLYIVKGIIDLHGGKIRVESKIGQGSKFIFTLPKK